jgi:hypothetical protein
VLGLLALMIAELKGRVGATVDTAIVVLLAIQSTLAIVTVALNALLLLLSARMDPVKCLGVVMWTVQRWYPGCLGRCLRTAEVPIPSPAKESLVAVETFNCPCATAPARLRSINPRLMPLLGVIATLRGREMRSALERRVALSLLVKTICDRC